MGASPARDSEQFLRRVVFSSPIAQFVIDADHRVACWNKALEALSGIQAEEMLGTKRHSRAFYEGERPCLADLLLDEATEKIKEWYRGECRTVNGAYEATDFFPRLGGSGKWLRFSAVALRDEEGHVVGAVETIEDISERRRAEEALRESEQKYRALVETTETGFLILDAQGKVVDANAEYVRLTGHKALAEILGRTVVEWTAPYDHERNAAEVAKCAATGRVRNLVVDYVGPKGVITPIEINATVVRTAEGTRLLSLCRDITERKQMEDRLRHSEKMEAIGQLAGGVAHDFNNQLTGIMGYAEMLGNRLEDESLRRYAELIIGSAKRSAELTRQLLAFARKGKFQSVPVDIHKVIGEVAALLRHTVDRRIAIMQGLKANPPLALGDPTQIQNALLNLALNARDAMPEGGELILATDVVVLDENYCRGNPYEIKPGRYVQICVTDSGVGMSEEVRRHLFEPFFTTKGLGKGTGMGLAAVYGTVKNHKGAINLYSEPGHGTTVKVYLPLLESAEQAETPAEVGEPVRGTARILVVDDEEVVLKLAAEALRDLGYQVTTCKDGAEAVAYYRGASRSIDLVILDMVMPALGGRETFLAMKDINPAVRAILSSGYSLNGQAQAILDEGVLDFVQKPFRLRELSAKVAAALGRGNDKATTRSANETT